MATSSLSKRLKRLSLGSRNDASTNDDGHASTSPPTPPSKQISDGSSSAYVSRLDPGSPNAISSEQAKATIKLVGAPTGSTPNKDKPLPKSPDIKHDSGNYALEGTQSSNQEEDYVMDLRDSVDTTVHERVAPAVTHETITHPVHEIREERITREVHEHHVYHRILPIEDVEILPARHFVLDSGTYSEVNMKDKVLDRARKHAQRVMPKAFESPPSKGKGDKFAPRQFSARGFVGTEGDYKGNVTPEGSTQTEEWWVHPPALETGAMESGQTQPFHFDPPNSTGGERQAQVPIRKPVGASPPSTRQQR